MRMEFLVDDRQDAGFYEFRSVRISSELWRADPSGNAALVKGQETILVDLCLEADALSKFRNLMAAWLVNRELFEHRLPGPSAADPELVVALIKTDRFICSLERPVFCLSYDDRAAMRSQWFMVVDETTVRRFVDELDELLAS